MRYNSFAICSRCIGCRPNTSNGSELPQVSAPRASVSGIARYLGKSRPAPQDRAFRYIAAAEHDHVKRAIVLLRLAVALNQDRASDVLRVTVRPYPKRVLLEIYPGRTGAELELWSLRKEAD